MDHRIYGKLPRTDLGVYGTRRWPKGTNAPLNPVTAADPFNRNPLTVALQYVENAVAPALNVVRWTYTVPPRRRCQIQAAEVEIDRATAGAGNTIVTAAIFLTRNGGTNMEIVRVLSSNDAAGASAREVLRELIDLYEGDRIRGTTSSNNGTVNFLINCHGIEFDSQEKIIGFEQAAFSDETRQGGSLFGQGALSAFRAPSPGGYAAKFPTVYSKALSLGYTETQARIAGDTGLLSGSATIGA